MSRFTIRQYSEIGPQDQSRILFESDSLLDVKEYIKNYFSYEDYFNAVYFIDNKLNKQGYVGRDLKINCGDSLSDFCEIQESKELEALKEIREKFGKTIMKAIWLPNAHDYTKTITINDYCDIIETELKRLEDDVETWKEVAEHKEKEYQICHEECVRLTSIKNKQDEILRIIKEKRVNVAEFEDWLEENPNATYEEFLIADNEGALCRFTCTACDEKLTQAEFDILKKQFSEN